MAPQSTELQPPDGDPWRGWEIYCALLENMGEALAVVDHDGVFRYMNCTAAQRLRGRAQDLIGKVMHDLFPPETTDRQMATVRRVIRTGLAETQDTCVQLPDGPRYYSTSVVPLPAAAGRPAAALIIARDVTSHQGVLDALRQSEAKYRTVVENTGDVVYAVDPEGRVTYISPQVKRYGLEPDEVVTRNFGDFIFPEDRERVLATFAGEILAGVAQPGEWRALDGEGRVVWLEDRAKIQKDADGRVTGMVGVLRDITERRRAEEAYRELVNHSLQGLSIVQDDRLVFANEALCRMTGCTREELQKWTIWEMILPDDLEMVRQRRRDREAGRPVPERYELRVRRKEGGFSWGEIFVHQAEYEGRPAWQVAFVDITQRKQAEADLLAYQQRLQVLSAEISMAQERERRRIAQVLHDDLQQILTAAKLQALALEHRAQSDDSRRKLTHIIETLDEGLRVTRSLTMDLSPPILQRGSLADVLRWLAEWMRSKHGLSVEVHAAVEEAAPQREEIRMLLFQAVRELLFNVVKHAGTDRADVRLSQPADGEIQIDVRDEGVGFDPCAAPAGGGQGGGFGLFSIRERLGLLGGRMAIDSAAGKGTNVTLWVPGRSPPAASPA